MAAQQARTPSSTGPSGALLVVDDDAVITATISSALRHAGFTVHEATHPAHALEICAERRPDLAILDNNLPAISGPQLAQALLDRHAVHSIFLSAYDNSDLVQEAVAAGAISYLLKPIDPLDLVPAVHAALSRVSEIRAMRAREMQLKESLAAARDINTAIGVLMERLHLPQETAFGRLRDYSRAQRKRVVDVARALLDPINAANQIATQITSGVASSRMGARSAPDADSSAE